MPPHLYFYSRKLYNINVFYLYILKSKKDNDIYIGSTNDLQRRLLEHNNGKVFSTKSRRPFEIRYYESYYNKEEARKRESSLKKDGRALSQLKIRISKSLQ